jgi:pimeloyl-ACP methyl ester carboxylesterase
MTSSALLVSILTRLASLGVWLSIVALVIGVVVSFFLSRLFLRPPWYKPVGGSGLPLTMEKLSKSWPSTFVHDPMHDCNLEYEDVEFDSHGTILRGWLVAPSPHHAPKPGRIEQNIGIVAVHGGGRDRRAFLRHLPVFSKHGYTTLLFDCASCGQSDGIGGLSYGARESMDAAAALEFMHSLNKFDHLILIGTSQGAASSIIASCSPAGKLATAVIAENPFMRPEMLIQQILLKIPSLLPRAISLVLNPFWALWWRMLHFAAVKRLQTALKHAARACSYQLIPDGHPRGILLSPEWFASNSLTHPIMYMHGTNDALIPTEHSERLYNATKASPDVELWIAQGASHTALYNVYPAEWEQRVVQFIDKHCK